MIQEPTLADRPAYEWKHYLLAAILAVATLGFGIRFLIDVNHEFLIYVVVVVLATIIVAFSHRKVRYPFACLIGLTVWAVLHLAGGGVKINGDVLYALILIPISETYSILRYDQVVHAWGFGSATLVMYTLFNNMVSPKDTYRASFAFLVLMAGIGLGALNENIEFLLTVLLPQTGVGGYINTSLDLCSNLLGAIVALLLVRFRIIDMQPIGRNADLPEKNI